MDAFVLQPWHWMVIGLVLCALELAIPTFFLLWFGVAALLTGLLSGMFDMSLTMQLLVWIGISVICATSWFAFISPRLKDKSLSGMAQEQISGKVGLVLEYHQGRGRLRFPAPLLGNDEWQFICQQPLQPGDRVRVIETQGNALLVEAAQATESNSSTKE